MLYNIEKQKNNAIIDFIIAVALKGGVENVMNQVARYLTQKGLHVRFIQLAYEHQPWAYEDAEFHYIYEGRNGHSLETFIEGYSNFLEEHEHPDMIIATNWPIMSTVARAATKNLGINVPIASWLHLPVDQYEQAGFGGMEHLQNADIHFVVNNIIKDMLIKNGEQIVYRSFNPVSSQRVHYNRHRNPHKLVYIGRLSIEKNISLIIKALSLTIDYELLIIGEGEGNEENLLKVLVHELGLDSRVTFHGWSNAPYLLAKDCGFLIISSIYEGGPLTAVEALHSGMPVISTPVGIVPEIIEVGVNGYLFPQNDHEFLARILNMLSTGALPVPSSKACSTSASQYLEESALLDFYNKIIASLEWRIIQE